MNVVADSTLNLKEASVVLTKLTETTLPEGLTYNVPGLDSPNKGKTKEVINSSNDRSCVESDVTRHSAALVEQNTKLTSSSEFSAIHSKVKFPSTSHQTSSATTTIKRQAVTVGLSLNEGDSPVSVPSCKQNEINKITSVGRVMYKHSEQGNLQKKNDHLCESSCSKKTCVPPGDRLEKIAAKLISRRESMQAYNLNNMQSKSMIEKAFEIKHKHMLTNIRKKEDTDGAHMPSYTCTLSKQTEDYLSVDRFTAPAIRGFSPTRPKSTRKARTVPNILSRSAKQKSLSVPSVLHEETIKTSVDSVDFQAKGNKSKFQKHSNYKNAIKQELPDIDTSRCLSISTKDETLVQATPKTTWFPGGISITNPKSFPYIKLLGNQAFKTPVVDVSRIKKEKCESDINVTNVEMATAEPDHDSSASYKTSECTLQENIKNQNQKTLSPFTSVYPRDENMEFRKSKISKVDDLASSSTNVYSREAKCTKSNSLSAKSDEKTFFARNSKKKDMNRKEKGIITYAEYCAQMDADTGVKVPTVPKSSKKNFQEKKISAITYADYCAQMDAAETGARRIESENIALGENQSSVIPTLKQSNLRKKKTVFSIMPSQAIDSSSVIPVPQLTNVNTAPNIKQEPDEDIDGNHLFDHGYTKTPDSSPSKNDATKASPPLCQNIPRPGRVTATASNCQSPVYAVKYGNKLFLIPSSNANFKTKLSVGPTATYSKLEQRQAQGPMSMCNVKCSKQKRKNCKRLSRKKMEFTRKLSLAQRRMKMSKKTSRISFKPKHGSKHHPVQRYAKVIHITPSASGFTGIIKRVSITLTKGADIELKRWHTFTDFQVRLTYDDDKCTLKHMEADSLKTGFYKVCETYELSNQKNRKTMAILSCVPPHQDILAEGEQFIAVGPMFNVFDAGITKDTTKINCSGHLQAYLSTILPASSLCILKPCISDTSYRPKVDAKIWYTSQYFDYFTRKICPNRRQTERKGWDHNHCSY